MKTSQTLISKVWNYLIVFSFTILIFLWLFQVIFLKSYYRYMKKKDIKEIVDIVSKEYKSSNFNETLDKLTFANNACIEIISGKSKYYSSESYIRGCILNQEYSNEYFKLKDYFLRSNEEIFMYETKSKFKNDIIVYGKKIDDIIVFVTTSLEPLDSTIYILSSQLMYVSLVTLLLSLLVAFFISKKISKPIIKINEKAKEISKGNYNINFNTDSNIKEINELSITLNNNSKELAKTEKLRRELMANVSHDLKTPLTMIKAYAEMARDLNNNNKEKRESNLNIIIEESDRLNLLVNDILELSKEQSMFEKIKIEEFELISFIDNIISHYNYLKERENYKFIFTHEEEIIVKADKKRIEQVLYNLINNAINHTGKDKKIYIKITTDDGVKIEIKDTGKGIPKSDIPFIWDKYYKVDKSYTRDTHGTGLGLSIVKNILINHNFKYGVESKENQGTTFWFIIK